MEIAELDIVRGLLCRLGASIRERIVAARDAQPLESLAQVIQETKADTIFAIDRVGEDGVREFLRSTWPPDQSVEIVMEGLEESRPLTHPAPTPPGHTRWRMILDPIDGTRGLIYDKRSAWVLAAVAPQRGAGTTSGDLQVAAMTEIPVTKQDWSDQVSGIRGLRSLVACRTNVRNGEVRPLHLRPSGAEDLLGGYASLSRFFPEGKALLADLEERFLQKLFRFGETSSPRIFEDQYASTGGQIFELLSGRDRMLGDLRPLIFRRLGFSLPLTCHPYDICTAMLLQEAGGVVLDPETGKGLACPLDTTSPVAWLGFANRRLAQRLFPVLREVLRDASLLPSLG